RPDTHTIVYFSSLTLRSTSHFFFYFKATATTAIYTLSLHDALPISTSRPEEPASCAASKVSGGTRVCLSSRRKERPRGTRFQRRDRKSTRLNSSHVSISYAVFCLKKKKTYKPS